MCGRLPFSTEYKLKVSGPQGAGAALCVLCPTVNLYLELSVVIYFMGFKVPTPSDKLPKMHVQAQKE